MRLRAFFNNFPQLTNSSNAIPALRDLILGLAIKGRLVAQDTRDEPASILLERIKDTNSQRSRLRGTGSRTLVAEMSVPFSIPSNWEWTFLSQVGHEWGQKRPNVDFTYIDVAAIDNQSGVITDEVRVLKPNQAPSRARKIVKQGTLLYSTVRPYLLNIAIVEKEYSPDAIASTAFAIIHPFAGISGKYLFYYLRSRPFIDFVKTQMQGVAYPAINDEKLFGALVPLPPTKEQERIVAKVDELMLLCDDLESKQQAKRESRVWLNNSALAPLSKAASLAPEEFEQVASRLAKHFDTLYDSIDTVSKLRSTILQLAVQGKLIPQHLKDEPASILLDQLGKKREASVYTKRRVSADVAAVESNNCPFGLPLTWRWTRLGQLTQLIEYGTSEKATLEHDGVPVLRMNNIEDGKVILSNLKFVSATIKDLPRLYLKTDELLFNRTNSYELVGKTGIFKGESDKFTFASYLIRIRLFESLMSPDYVNLAMNAEYFRKTQINNNVTQQCDQANFNGTKLANTLIPLPPLAEQKRIVSKVNQLMVLCDELETKLRQAEAHSEKLMNAAVQHVLQTVSSGGPG